MTILDAMNFYTKLLAGMVLLLNIGLLVSIRMVRSHARDWLANDDSENGAQKWLSAKRNMAALLLTVICMNAGAVYAYHQIQKVTRELAAEIPQNTDAEIALSMVP